MIIAYYALRYGLEYLPWSMRSVEDAVDEFHFLYATEPSFGTGESMPCPETEEQLLACAKGSTRKPVFWHAGRWDNEGHQRGAINQIAKDRGADQMLWVDSDEVWAPGAAKDALTKSAARPEYVVRVRFVHFWRSFWWACTDPAMPTRVVNMKRDNTHEWYLENQVAPVLHFGYAQRPATVLYKQTIHGHKGEWRNRWFEDIFMPWRPGGRGDVHPTCEKNFWDPRPFGPPDSDILKEVLGDHPNFGKELIE